MYAIVEIGGKQFRVSKGDTLNVPKLSAEAGKSVEFDKVLLIANKGKISVGRPSLAGAKVKAQVEGFGRDRKVIVFRKKRRKGFQVTRGHRQDFTEITISGISQAKKKVATKKAATKKAGEQEDGA